MNQKKKKRKSCKLVIESDFECFSGDDEDVSKSDGHTCVGWERGDGFVPSQPPSLWPPPAKSSAPCTCSEPWVHFRENCHRNAFHALDKTLQDLRGSSAIKGGTTVVLSGVYPNIQQNFKDQDWLSHRAILASRNDVVEKLNATIQKQLSGQEYAYKSIDCILNDEEAVQYPIEFLNSIQTPDLQAHNLILKVGAPIMLIRNIDAPRLCNGT
ncbi:ATP-dependent DNA helicase [Trichonephila clavata]|uniref:ATP-dependent DNA helicase n=1 Tax=Trichonephila clavata TaxID=2740835 RepID=A0A8X6KB32_TRICU|nr:ATP-dependent DNA helicase [Trichonephila clavata]